MPPSSSGLGHRPFKPAARIRIPLGAPPATPRVEVRTRLRRSTEAGCPYGGRPHSAPLRGQNVGCYRRGGHGRRCQEVSPSATERRSGWRFWQPPLRHAPSRPPVPWLRATSCRFLSPPLLPCWQPDSWHFSSVPGPANRNWLAREQHLDPSRLFRQRNRIFVSVDPGLTEGLQATRAVDPWDDRAVDGSWPRPRARARWLAWRTRYPFHFWADARRRRPSPGGGASYRWLGAPNDKAPWSSRPDRRHQGG